MWYLEEAGLEQDIGMVRPMKKKFHLGMTNK
jgi:hypothetical protein